MKQNKEEIRKEDKSKSPMCPLFDENRCIDIRNLVDVVGGTQSITEWSKEVMQQYHAGLRHPKELILTLIQKEDGRYFGQLYIERKHFEERYK